MGLIVNSLSVNYGVINAVKNISLYVDDGEIVTLLGSNGAGKTTTLRAISGLEKAKSGSILWDGEDITNIPGQEVVAAGIAHVPEGRRIFSNLTVLDNLLLGANLRKDKNQFNKDLDHIYSFFPILNDRKNQIASTLSGGEQQMLAIGRAIMSRAKMILLDEPSMGLAPIITGIIFEIIKQISDEGTTILLVEQNAHQALKIADRAYVIETGEIVHEGPSFELADDERIKEAYLGSN